MAYGDYDGPDKPDKGEEGGSCFRTACQVPGATHFGHARDRWYCSDCATVIGRANALDAPRLWPDHPMFETRAEIDARKNTV